MKVTKKNKERKSLTFDELNTGDWFYDAAGDLSVKSLHEKRNAIVVVRSGGTWPPFVYDYDTEEPVRKVEVEIVVEE